MIKYLVLVIAITSVLMVYSNNKGNKTEIKYCGKSKIELNYDKDGKMHGWYRIWNDKNQLREEAYYHHNFLIKSKSYDDNGKIIHETFEDSNHFLRSNYYLPDGTVITN